MRIKDSAQVLTTPQMCPETRKGPTHRGPTHRGPTHSELSETFNYNLLSASDQLVTSHPAALRDWRIIVANQGHSRLNTD